MKKLYKRFRSESGAVAVMSVFIVTVLIGFTALSLDIGLHYYLGARLQKATDAAATAVAGSVDAENPEEIAYEYLALNGYDKSVYDDKLNVDIKKKGLLDEETLNEDDYITTGYYKITATATDSTTNFAKFFGVESYNLQKVAYAKCDANYVEMPEALKYSIFAGSIEGTQNDAAIKLNGRTGVISNTITDLTDWLISGINDKIISPILRWFKKDTLPDPKINTSEIVLNADAHSNSTVSIGVQALNTSRIKDSDFNGENASFTEQKADEIFPEEEGETTPKNDDIIDDGAVTITAAYSRFNKGAGKVYFNRRSIFPDDGSLTHIYTQNRQYLEHSAMALNIVDSFTYSENNSINNNNDDTDLSSLKYRYKTNSENYMRNVNLIDFQEAAIINQKDNIRFISDGVYRLENQKNIVYDISHEEAAAMLDVASTMEFKKDEYGNYLKDEAGNNVVVPAFTHIIGFVERAGIDYATNNDGSRYFGDTIDRLGTYEQEYTLNKVDPDTGARSKSVMQITGTTINRDFSKVPFSGATGALNAINNLNIDGATKDKTAAGATYAMARTLRQNARYISIPNLRPYFTRQINQSVKYATQDKDGAVGEADKTVKRAVATKIKVIDDTLKDVAYKDWSYFKYDQSGDASKTEESAPAHTDSDPENNSITPTNNYSADSFKYNDANAALFTYYKANKDSRLTDLTSNSYEYSTYDWTLGDLNKRDNVNYKRDWEMSSTEYKGYKLYNNDGSLKSPTDYVNEFKNRYIPEDENSIERDKTYYASAAIAQERKYSVEHDDDHDDYLTTPNHIKTDYANHYGAEAVAKKKAALQKNVSYTGVESKYDNFVDYAPGADEVFLKSTGTVKERFDLALNELRNITPGASSGGNVATVEKPELDDPNTQWNVTSTEISNSVSKPFELTPQEFDLTIAAEDASDLTITAGDATYKMEDLLPAYDGVYGKVGSNDTTIAFVLQKFLEVNDKAPEITVNVPSQDSYIWDSTNFDGARQDSYDENNYLFRLQSGRAYGRVSNPKKRKNLVTYNMGIEIMDGRNVYLSNGLYLSEASHQNVKVGNDAQLYVMPTSDSHGTFFIGGSAGALTVGDRSIVYIDGNANCGGTDTTVGADSTLYITGDYPYPSHDRALQIGARSKWYVGGEAHVNGNYFRLKDNAKAYIGGKFDYNNAKEFTVSPGAYLYVGGNLKADDNSSDCGITIQNGATVIVNGDMQVNNKNTLTVGPNVTLIVTGELDCSNISADPTSTIYAGSINCGNSSGSITFGDLYVASDVNMSTNLSFGQNAQVLINGNLSIPGKTLTIGNDARVEMAGTIQSGIGAVNYNGTFGLYLGGQINNSAINITVPAGSGICATSININSLTVNGGYVCVPGTLSLSTLYNNSLTYAHNLTVSGTIINDYSLYVENAINCSSNIENNKKIYAESITASGAITNANNCTIYADNTITAGSISNMFNLRADQINSGALTTSGLMDVSGNVNCSSLSITGLAKASDIIVNGGNYTNGGTTVCTGLSVGGSITNTNLIVVNGNASANGIDNSGNGMYITGNLNATGVFASTKLYVAGTITGSANITNGYIMVVDGGVQSSEFHNYGQLLIGKTLTVYRSGGTVLENNGDIKVGTITGNAAITTKSSINVVGALEDGSVIGGTIDAASIVNVSASNQDTVIYALGYINCAGNLTNGSSRYTNAIIYTEHYLYIGGNLENYGRIGVIGGDYTDYTGTLMSVTIMGAYINGGALYVPNGGVDLRGAETHVQTDVFSNYGNLILEGNLTNLIANGTLRSGQIVNYGNLYIKNNFSLEYLYNVDGGRVACDGDITFTGYYDDNCSFVNEGEAYINGDINSVGTVVVDNGVLYVYGDISGANVNANNESALLLKGDAEVYIKGWVTSVSNNRKIRLVSNGGSDEACNAVLSIYGDKLLQQTCIDETKITSLDNTARGSRVYLGTGTTSDTLWNQRMISINEHNDINNYGSMYVYGSLYIPYANNMNLRYEGETFISNRLIATNTEIKVTEGHTLVVSGPFNANRVTANAGKVYLMDSTVNANYFDITNGSTFYVDKSSGFNYNDTSNHNFRDSTIYLPEPASGTLRFSDINFNGGGIVTNANLIIDSDIEIKKGVMLYVGGQTTITGDHKIVNNGKMYFVGGTDLSGLKKVYSYETGSWPNKKTHNQYGIVFGEGSDTFIGGTITDKDNNNSVVNGSIYSPSVFIGNGNIYVEGDIYASYDTNKLDSTIKSGDRQDGMFINSGKTYFSGNVKLLNGNSLRVNTNASLSCGGDLTMGSAIYNKGKTVVFGSLNMDNSNVQYLTDSGTNNHGAVTLLNGSGSDNDNSGAEMYVGGTAPITFYGAVKNSGRLYLNTPELRVQGYLATDGINGDSAFINYIGSSAHIGGDVYLNSNVLFNRADPQNKDTQGVFSCSGNLKFGICIYNCGTVVAGGDITNNEVGSDTINNKKYNNGNAKGIMNGAYKINYNDYYKCVFPNALMFCGGDMQIGVTQEGGEGGSYMTFGTTYIGGELKEYCNTSNSFYKTGFWGYDNSDTFIGGDCFVGGGVATGDNSIFMCGGDFTSKRSLKINVHCQTLGNYAANGGAHFTTFNEYPTGSSRKRTGSIDDNYTPSYFYVGGNLIANSLGKVLWNFNSTLYIPNNYSRDLDIMSNTNMFVGGQMYANAALNIGQNANVIVAGAKRLNETSQDFIFGNSIDLGTISGKLSLAQAYNSGKYGLYTPKTLTVEPCSNLIVNGSGYVYDNVKLRDMVKSYFNGDFRSVSGYVEIGKALDGVDETEARETTYRVKGDSDGEENRTTASYKRAGYMSVNGDFTSGKYTKVYAATTLRVGGDFVSNRYLTLRHDASIYVGKKLKAATSIEGGSYSRFFVNGSMQATTQFIKLRDRVTCFVGGNMVSYLGCIELGKAGDYVKTKKSTVAVADGGQAAECTCCDDCTDNVYCQCGCDSCKWKDGTNTSNTGADADNSTEDTAGAGETVKNEEAVTVTKSDELQNDANDKAYGGQFYIRGALTAYSKYIKEFAYSQSVIGGYVYTPAYITLRHNADMWVIPEIYEKSTYVHKDYEWNSDGTLLGDIREYIKKGIYDVTDFLSFKNGSVYSLGQVTLNTNASIFASYDLLSMGKYIMCPDTLVYLGHDFTCVAASVDGSLDSWKGITEWVGFDTDGRSEEGYKLICTNRAGHKDGLNYTSYISKDDYSSYKTYACDLCGQEFTAENIREGQLSYPAIIYADNEIDIRTTMSMHCTYLVANKGDVDIRDIYTKADNYELNAIELPNAICSYQSNINFNAIYSKIGALFYAPKGNVDFDGMYSEIWGCCLGDTVTMNAYYLNFHRFANWRTMDLHLAESGSVYLISQREYEDAEDNLDDSFKETSGGSFGTTADIFF